MRFEFNVTGSDRKALVTAMGEILNVKPKYMGMPSMNYEVDYFTVTKDGAVEFDDRADSEEIEQLLESLADKDFVAAPAEMAQAWLDARAKESSEETAEQPQGETVGLTVAISLDKVAVGNLTNLLDAKGSLSKGSGIDATPIESERTRFPSLGLERDWMQTRSRLTAISLQPFVR